MTAPQQQTQRPVKTWNVTFAHYRRLADNTVVACGDVLNDVAGKPWTITAIEGPAHPSSRYGRIYAKPNFRPAHDRRFSQCLHPDNFAAEWVRP